jgi:hypothetical protein
MYTKSESNHGYSIDEAGTSMQSVEGAPHVVFLPEIRRLNVMRAGNPLPYHSAIGQLCWDA